MVREGTYDGCGPNRGYSYRSTSGDMILIAKCGNSSSESPNGDIPDTFSSDRSIEHFIEK